MSFVVVVDVTFARNRERDRDRDREWGMLLRWERKGGDRL